MASRSCNWRTLVCGLLLAALPLTAAAAPVLAPVPQASSAPIQPPPSATLRFEHLAIEQGLSQSTVATILQDRYGFMWFGTDDGLNRYDGYQFTVYRHDPDDPASLSQGGIQEIYEDSTGTLWLRTSSGGLDRYDRDRNQFVHYRRPEGGIGTLEEDFVWDLYEDRSGTIWAGAYLSGLYRYDRANDSFVQYRHNPADPASLSDDRVYAIFEDSAGTLWVGTAKGLDRLDRERGRFTHFQHDPADPTTLAGERVQLIQEDRQGRLWVATFGTGLNLFDRAKSRVTRYVHDPANPQSIDQTTRISELYEDHRGDLWVRHYDGRLDRLDPDTGVFKRFRHDPAQPETVTASADPSHDNVSFIKEDRNGNVWIGTFGGGLDWFDPDREQFIHYRHAPYDPGSLSDNQLLTFYEDRAGDLWIGTWGHGLNRFDPAQLNFPHYRIEPQALDAAENNVVLDVRADRSGLIWVGSTVGLSSFDRTTGQVTRYRHDPEDPASLSAGRVWSVYEDAQGRIWVGTETSLDRLDRATGRFTHFKNTPDDPSASYGIISAITGDGAGGLWLGVYGRGLERFDPEREQFTHYEYHLGEVQANKIFYWEIWAVYPDRSGRVWIGTTKGLYGLDPQTGAVVHYDHDPADPASLSGNEIHAIFEDSAGRLWIGTWGGGLNLYDRATGKFTRYSVKDGLPNNTIYCIQEDAARQLWLSTNNGLARFDPEARAFRNYDASDGLQSSEFNTGACSQTAEGEMLFGGVNGFNAFYPDRVRDNSFVPPVVLTALTGEGKPLAGDRAVEGLTDLTLRWPNDAFEFEFASLSFSQPDKNRYAYMLTPLETEWTQIGSRRFGSYTNLPGGAYTLRVKGSNSAGVWNEAGTSLNITVIPPFWETWTFRGLLLLALAGITFGAYRWRIASIENRSRQLAVEVADRTLTIAGQTADLEALYQADEELERHVQLDQVLQALVDIAVDLLDADKSAVLAWDEGRERLAIRVARNFSADAIAQITFAPGEGFAGQVMASGGPVMVEDAESDMRRVPERPEIIAAVLGEGIRSFMHIPIRLATSASAQPTEASPQPGEVFGVFTVGYHEPRAFGDREQRLFTALAQRAALAVQNAQHFAAEQRRAEQFRVIGEVGRRITSILDVDQLLGEVLGEINRAFGYEVMGIALIEGDELVMKASCPPDWHETGAAPLRLKVGETGVMGWVAKTGQPAIVPDVSLDSRYVQWPSACQTRSELAVPLLTVAGIIGVLNVESETVNAFDESDVAVMQALANQTAIAIENARLYENSNRQVAQLTALQETNRAVTSTLERDALLSLIMEQANTLLRADGGMINLVDWEKHEDEVVAYSGAAAQFMGARDSLDTSLSGWTTLRNQPVISNCLAEDERVAPEAIDWLVQARIESAALAPLTIKDRVAGTLVLIKEHGKGGFDQTDLELLVAFADQAAIAIENARLYEEAHQVAASQERSRLARDLHDAVTQTLFSASLIAEVLPGLWESDPAEGRQLLGELRQLTRGALAEMRTLLLELRPAALVEANLGDLLRQLAESVSGRTGIPVVVLLEGCPVPDLPDDVHVALYRIAQEALNNVVKHAQAHRVEITLRCSREREGTKLDAGIQVELRISDDGRGFNPAIVSPDHLGLSIIRERAQAIGAQLRVESDTGKGTVVAVMWQ